MSHPLERVDDLAVQAFYFLGEGCRGGPINYSDAGLGRPGSASSHPRCARSS
jgi:hypothetical protein